MATVRRLDTSLKSNDMYEFTYHLLNDDLFLPDILKDCKRLMETTTSMFNVSEQPYALTENGKIGGVFFSSGVIAGHQADFYIWVWERGVITTTTLRFVKDYIESIAEEYQLVRLSARAACKKAGRLYRALGLKEEGRLRAGFKSGGRLHTLFLFRRLWGRGHAQ